MCHLLSSEGLGMEMLVKQSDGPFDTLVKSKISTTDRIAGKFDAYSWSPVDDSGHLPDLL